MAELQLIPIEQLHDHPQNPRVIRQDVISAIAANMNGEFDKSHALKVRPLEDGFQILPGHHRRRATEESGLCEVWCWVESMDDDAAFMELVLSNNQGELSALEIGIHAYQAIETRRGKSGGGIAEYASAIGKAKQNVGRYRQAGEVCKMSNIDITHFVDKAEHLARIHKLPEPCWQPCCEWLGDNEASVADVSERVSAAVEFEVPNCECDDYVHQFLCQRLVFTGSLNQNTVDRLASLCDKVAGELDDDLQSEWFQWLRDNAGEDSYDIQKCQDKRIELESIQWERDNPQDDEHEQELVQVLLADPPWRYEHADPSRAIENQYPTADADEIAKHLELPWAPQLADDCVLFMWTTAPKLQEAFTVLDGWGFTYRTHAIWDKERIGMGYWFRSQHELLLVAVKGSPPTPGESLRLPSIFRERRDNKHSKKPESVYQALDRMFPNFVKCEMYQREPRDGWLGCGNEASNA